MTQLSARHTFLFSFLDDNLSKFQWIFTKLDMCIDIVEIWFEIANGQVLLILTELSAHHISVLSFPDDNLSKCQLDFHQTWYMYVHGFSPSDLGL